MIDLAWILAIFFGGMFAIESLLHRRTWRDYLRQLNAAGWLARDNTRLLAQVREQQWELYQRRMHSMKLRKQVERN